MRRWKLLITLKQTLLPCEEQYISQFSPGTVCHKGSVLITSFLRLSLLSILWENLSLPQICGICYDIYVKLHKPTNTLYSPTSFFSVEACVAERSTPRTLDLEVRGRASSITLFPETRNFSPICFFSPWAECSKLG